MSSFIREACVGSLQQAIMAERRGADRIELCANLDLDGLTPSEDLIRRAKDQLNIPVRVMVRPRAGNFVYSETELDEMKRSIEFCKEIGVEGVVFGVLKKDDSLDIEAITRLTSVASPLKVVIHKAIDDTPDPLKALEELSAVNGISTVLTSGGAKTAIEGKHTLKKMIEMSSGIEVMAAGKLTSDNLQEIDSILGASAYHGKLVVGNLDRHCPGGK